MSKRTVAVVDADGHVVEPVGRHVGVAEAAKVRDHHLEAGRRQRRDDSPPQPLALGPPMDQHDRHAASALVDVCLAEPSGARVVRQEGGRVHIWGGHPGEGR